MKKIVALLLTLVIFASLTACASPAEEKSSAYEDALAVFTAIWDAFPEDQRFSAFGGNQNESAVMDAPGAFDLTDTDGLTRLLLVPEAVQGKLVSAASLVHMMNTNSFTGAVLELSETAAADTTALIETITGNHFMCGFPEKLVVLTLDGFVLYAYGGEQQVNTFRDAATTALTGEVSVVYDDWMM